MAKSDAQKRAVKKWESTNYWRPMIRLPKSLETEVRAHCGDSINGFIRTAIEEKLEREK